MGKESGVSCHVPNGAMVLVDPEPLASSRP
jgi:hypothetical protein